MYATLSASPLPSLRDVAAQLARGDSLSSALAALDSQLCVMLQWKRHPRPLTILPASLYAEEPPDTGEAIERVLLAGLGEMFAGLADSTLTPAWTSGDGTFLTEVTFIDGGLIEGRNPDRLRLFSSTPGPMRRRMLFCGPVLPGFCRLVM